MKIVKCIVKVQKPVFSTDPDAQYLVYAGADRWGIQEQDIPRQAKKALGDDLKGYFRGEIAADLSTKWTIRGRVPDQDW